jgi:hypothetical protein
MASPNVHGASGDAPVASAGRETTSLGKRSIRLIETTVQSATQTSPAAAMAGGFAFFAPLAETKLAETT